MEEEDQRELQLLPAPSSAARSNVSGSSSTLKRLHRAEPPPPPPSQPNLQLSISLQPPSNCALARAIHGFEGMRAEFNSIEALKRHAAEQVRLATVEKAYAERVRELSRREMEMAEAEFAQAKHVWERAQQEVESARRIKEKATRRVDSACMEITCQACRRRFRS